MRHAGLVWDEHDHTERDWGARYVSKDSDVKVQTTAGPKMGRATVEPPLPHPPTKEPRREAGFVVRKWAILDLNQ